MHGIILHSQVGGWGEEHAVTMINSMPDSFDLLSHSDTIGLIFCHVFKHTFNSHSTKVTTILIGVSWAKKISVSKC